MKKVLSINASPKGKKAASFALLEHINKGIDHAEKKIISIASYQKKGYEEIMREAGKATEIVLAFPLYVDCIPALMQEFMEKYQQSYDNGRIKGKKNLYTVINCGFPEAKQNRTAMEIMKEFARSSGFTWKTGVGIGMGGMVNPNNIPPSVKIVRPVYDELKKITEALNNVDARKNTKSMVYVSPHLDILGKKIMKILYIIMGNIGWKQQARKNRAAKKLYAKPYMK